MKKKIIAWAVRQLQKEWDGKVEPGTTLVRKT